MDDARFGMAIRAARLKRGWRQRDLARMVGVSDSVISRLERGHIDGISVGTLRRVANALEIRVELVPRSRSASVDRLVAGKHAALAEAVLRWLVDLGGWTVRPEVSFSFYADRGVIDLLAWHAPTRSLLVIELKTAIVNVGEILGVLDVKVRNAIRVAERFGWVPLSVSSLLIIAEGSTNRRRVDGHSATFAAALPARLVSIRRWVRAPAGALHGLMFFADRRQGQVIQRFEHRERVRAPRGGRRTAGPRSAQPRRDDHDDVSTDLPTVLTARSALDAS